MASSMPRPSRRRTWVVNRPLQFRFVGAMVLVLCVMGAAAVAAVYLAVWATFSSFELSQDPVLGSLLESICWAIVVELIVMAPLVIWLGIRLTHRVAGPLVRIYAALAQLSTGDFDVHITLRKGDELVAFATIINRLAASLRARRPP